MLTTAPPATTVIVIRDVRVNVTHKVKRFASCRAAQRNTAYDGWGGLRVDYSWTAAEIEHGEYIGTMSARVSHARILLPTLFWPKMTRAERSAAAASDQAMLRHERGHIIIALRALRAQHLPQRITVPLGENYHASADRRSRALLRQLDDAAVEYDRETAHGLRQGRASLPELRGPSTAVTCP